MSVTVEVRIGRRRMRIVRSPICSLLALLTLGKRDVEALVVLGRSVGDRHLGDGTSSRGTSTIEPSSRSIRTSTAWASSPRPRWTER